jgi:endo-1,4-beta-xylanase
VQGTYTYTEAATHLVLYIESSNPTAEYYIDDVTIVMTSPPTQSTEVLAEYNFDDGTTQGWVARSDVPTTTVAAVTDTYRSEAYSLKVTGRSQGWHGASVDVTSLLDPGVTYEISGCVKLVGGEPPSRLIFSMQRTVLTQTTYTWLVRSDPEGVTDSEWTCLHASYPAGESDQLVLYVESDSAAASVEFYLDDVTILSPAQPPIQTDIPSVKDTYSTTFLIGAAVETYQFDSLRHTQLLTYHFNSLTAENAMKPGSIQPISGTFNWAGADQLVQFARDNDMAVHGHTLVWHQQAAEWMFQDDLGDPLEATPENKTLVLQRLEDHIRAVVGRYQYDVNVWDVVNEVIDESQPDCMRRTEWYRLTGTDYISVAFNIAHEVAPTATLILNDYSTTNPAKRECIYTVVQDLQSQGVPVHGIGMQLHVNIQTPSAGAIETAIARFAELGQVHVTELDMSIYPDSTSSYSTVPEEILILQGYRYYEIFDIFKRHAGSIGSVTLWGMGDDHTWLSTFPITRINLPLLFDEQLQAKYAYWGAIGNLSMIPPLIRTQDVTQGTPVVDGSSELLWDMLPWVDIPSTETITASYQLRWDEDYLYVLVDVQDATSSPTDTIDIFIDENNSKSATYDADDVHYTFQNGVCSPTVGVTCTAQTMAGGYMLEAAFPFSMTASTGITVGFDIRITDNSQPGSPTSWNDPTNGQDSTLASCGTLTLIDQVKVTEAIHGLPVIDAVEDDAWAGANEISTDVWVQGSSGATAKVKTMWGAGHLYVYAVVSDTLLSQASSNPYEDDSIEVFVDQNNGKTSDYESDDAQYRVNFDNEQSYNGSASDDKITSATRVITANSVITPGEVITKGYVVELAIRLDAVTPADGVMIGFDFQVNNDEDGDGVRDTIAKWQDPTDQSYQNTSRFGVLTFSGVEYTYRFPMIMVNGSSSDTPADVSTPDRRIGH